MAKVVQTTLQISESNVEQYCIADGLSLNTGGYAIRLYLNGHTQGSAILNNAAKEVLYPSATAHPFKVDSFIRANKSGGSMTISLQFDGTSVQSEAGDWGSALKNKTKEGISDPVVINSNRSTEIKWHIKGSSTVSRFSIASTRLTFYFNQYEMSANKGTGADGVKSVSVSNSSPYQGDTVTFTPTLVNGATWYGWYSDAQCTQLVSTEQNYSIVTNSDITLYAKAVVEAVAYNCSAVAGENVTSATVDDDIVVAGNSATFTATIPSYCVFDGWYTALTGGTKVSGDNPYTAIINSDTTLYARATKIVYTVQVGSQPEHGTANVNASTATYGDVVTFTANIAGANREFYGWYSDSSYTNLVSDSATYNHTVTGNTTLYPKSGKTRYTAILHPTYASDVRPYRGSSSDGVKAASPSVPQNVNVLANNTVNSSTYAYQSYRASAAHNYGIAFWINNVEQLNSAPDNATIFDLYAQVGLSFSDTNYNSATAYSGTYTYLCEGDETPAIQRGTNVNIPISTNKTIVTINKSQMGDWTIKELKEGKLGFQINTSVKRASGTREQRFYGIDVYVVYTIEDTSYKCEAISDGHVDVSVSSHDVVPGGSCTWTAVQEGGYRFDGWYSDPNFGNLVSTSATYTTTIDSNKTLYAKTHYHSRVVSRELDIPYGQGRTYFTGEDINGNILDPDASGSGWKPDFDLASYNWLSNLVGIADVKATAASCNGPEYVSAVINSTGMNILYPNDTAHPVKMDSHALLGRAALTATILTTTLTNPITEDDTIAPIVDGIQSRIWRPNNINDVPYNFTNLRLPSILNSTRNSTIEYRMHQYVRSGYRAIGVDDIRLTMYFEEYDFSAQIADNAQGIEAVACSKAIGYEGDSVTYTAALLPGVTWNGWYADPNCDTLVSTEQTYTTVPNGNLTLYASASTDLVIYSCSAIAGDNVDSASCNHLQMTAGHPVTFTASVTKTGWEFDGWYLNGEEISSNNPYSRTITANTVLEARAKKTVYTIAVVQSENCTITISSTTATYGDTITMTCTPDVGYSFVSFNIVNNGTSQTVSQNPGSFIVNGNSQITATVSQDVYTILVGESPDGVATVSAATAHYGERVTFTFTPNEGVSGNYGWYRDAELTQVVSRENPYVHRVTGNITLYPGIVQQIGTGLYIKINGTFVESNVVYKKIDGAWVQLSDSELIELKSEMQSGNYRVVTSDQ